LIGALTGITALGLQLWQLALSGVKVKVKASFGIKVPSGETMIFIDVQNIGRVSCTVRYLSIEFSNSKKEIPVSQIYLGYFVGPELPLRLEFASNQNWGLKVLSISEAISGDMISESVVRGRVTLSNGKVLRTNRYSIAEGSQVGPIPSLFQKVLWKIQKTIRAPVGAFLAHKTTQTNQK
jgi:hypothetical protein